MHGSVTFRHGVVGKVGLDSSLQNPNAKTFPLKHSTRLLPLLVTPYTATKPTTSPRRQGLASMCRGERRWEPTSTSGTKICMVQHTSPGSTQPHFPAQ